ncbi:MAG: hypothetical protein A2W25_03080 [candidate division Zixibacteria bacterium RBG_16_53_22]|nr:MAG: hypothetical protein A2W25_03080 [candidate division Zixibacteria bacterium RBG_16_53_22]
MKKISTLILMTSALVNLWPIPAAAVNSNAGTAAYTFLKIGTGAKSQGLGGAFVGLADDATALYYNPAGLTARGEGELLYDELLDKPLYEMPKNRFTASYINYLVDFQYGFLGYVRQLDSLSSIGASASYQNYGTFDRLDAEGAELGTFGASDIALALTYSKRLSARFSAGITGKAIFESIDDSSSTGLAADIGLMYLMSADGSSRLGLALTNLGAQLDGLTESHKDKLPTKVAAGLSHRLVGLPFLFSAEAGKPFDNDFYAALGMELVSLRPFFVRMGWTTQGRQYRAGGDNDFAAGLAGGFGVTYKNYQIDYSYSSYADLGSVHRISLGAGF